ncbi:hypothetical protein GQ600_321 [Phytophthora cactorum]|nr:hypothetical protein GQ600_21987 [Phytophthora cactorum]KAF1787528.1 hypothetical protein GQ600_321 [Phytophthora cactorum]
MEQYEDDLACVQALMMRLRTLKQSAKFRLKTSLLPVIRQETRWSSTFSMVQRNFKLLEHLDPTDDAIVDVLPAPPCNKRLLSLLKDLKKGRVGVQGTSRCKCDIAGCACVVRRSNCREATLRQAS